MSNTLNHPKECCGVFGVFGHPNAAELTYYGLRALQNRGQESAGIVTSNGKGFKHHHGMGLVKDVFTGRKIKHLKGKKSVGHTRYSTTGSSSIKNAQPLIGQFGSGEEIAIAHNGNLTNAPTLRGELAESGAFFQTDADTELILLRLGKARLTASNDVDALTKTLPCLEGAYSLALLTKNALFGIRDPFGFRPLVIGKKDDGWFLSSETAALDHVEAEFVREVQPGEIVMIGGDGLRSFRAFPEPHRHASCIFEFVYFSRPDSDFMGENVYEVRKRMGRQLAKEWPADVDMVIPVPDGGNGAAIGYAQELGLPFEMAFVRNHFSGRSFIEPDPTVRELNARVKLNLNKKVVAGKRVVVVDDSIVRGTQSKARVGTLKRAGAKEVHVRVSCPPHLHPCRYGVDFPDRSKLMAVRHDKSEICRLLGADSVEYLSLEGMVGATGIPMNNFCLACYTGLYLTAIPQSIPTA